MRFLIALLLLLPCAGFAQTAADTTVTAEVVYRTDSTFENGDTAVVVSIDRIKVVAKSGNKSWEVPVNQLTPEFRDWLFDMRKRKKITGHEEYKGRMLK